jgi:hypothetical protein
MENNASDIQILGHMTCSPEKLGLVIRGSSCDHCKL